MKVFLFTLFFFLISPWLINAQKYQMTDLDYYNKAVYYITKKGDITSGQIYMDLAFSKGFGQSIELVLFQINQDLNIAFDHKENKNYFYVPQFLCTYALSNCNLTKVQKEKVYTYRGIVNYYLGKDYIKDLELGGEEGKNILLEIKQDEIQAKENKKKTQQQRPRLKKDPNFKID